jgi:acetoin utilization deacetylase AcuC-like enzyme
MKKTAYTFVPAREHQYLDHPERPERLDALDSLFARLEGVEQIKALPATVEQVVRVHQPRLIKAVEEVCKQGPGIVDQAPTYVTLTSYQDALLAAGGAVACTRAVLNGDVNNAFAVVRPPGHHAEPGHVMGFCIFNNIAIAACEALANGMERVMVIDYDAHHGNGTQAACMDDERFGFISTHQWGIYPGTGWIEDAPHARGRLVNVPLSAFAGDEVFACVADEIFKPVVEKFRPQMLFISAGFDSHWNDPLTSLGLSTHGFFNISKKLIDLADEYCQSKIVFVLEGGYDPRNVANGLAAVFDALTNSALCNGIHDLSPHLEPDHEPRIADIRKLHGIKS